MKKRLLCPHLPRKGTPAILSETEAHHAIRVLRLRDGEIVEALDGNGHQGQATLRIRGGQPRLEFLETESDIKPHREAKSLPLILEMAVLKGEAMEWIVEKAVELGVQILVPVLTDYTVVQMKSKPPESFRERWQKIADQALKQCGRLDRMEIRVPTALDQLLTGAHEKGLPAAQKGYRLWCDEKSAAEAPFLLEWFRSSYSKDPDGSLPHARILIGPEGGWSQEERELLIRETQSSHPKISLHRIDLGPRILRAETAALFSVSIASAHLYQLAPSP